LRKRHYADIEVTADLMGLTADDPDECAQAVIRLHQDPVLWEQLAVNGLDNLRLHFSPTAARLGLCQSIVGYCQ